MSPRHEGFSEGRIDQRSDAAKKASAHKTPEERAAAARKAAQSSSHEEKSRERKIDGPHSKHKK